MVATDKFLADEVSGPAALTDRVSRREFLRRMGLLGGGLVVYLTVGDLTADARAPRTGYAGVNVPTDFNAFIRIGTDNRTTCFVGKIEMGQGPITSFAQMVAEELDVAYESVDMVMGDTDLCPWDAGTWGSLSTRYGKRRGVRQKASRVAGDLRGADRRADHRAAPKGPAAAKARIGIHRQRFAPPPKGFG